MDKRRSPIFQDLREVKRLERELVQSERLAAIGQTVAGLAHGVKNVLQGFKGGSCLVDIGIEKQDTEKLKKGWAMIQRNIVSTSDLVLDPLSYSKHREPEFEACDPNAIVDLTNEKASSHAITLTTDLDPRMGTVVIDPRTLHHALLNLVTNAMDACIFDADTTKVFRLVIVSRREPGGWVSFSVTDNGISLGLLATRKLVEAHGGDIAFPSLAGQGTTFVVRLPYKSVATTAPRS